MRENTVNMIELSSPELRKLSRHWKRRRMSAFITGAAVCFAVLAFGVRAYNSRLPFPGSGEQPSARAVAEPSPTVVGRASGQPGEKVQVELVTLRPHGFEPKEIARNDGRFLLAVDNRTGTEKVTLVLERIAGERLNAVSLPRERSSWHNLLSLPPGQYKLTESDHPDWVCNITVTAR